MSDIERRINEVKQRIAMACARSGRDASEVEIIAVTKYVTSEITGEILDLGIHHIGENRVQDAVPKWEKLGNRGTWHFIGHLQSNKVKDIIGKFAYIHSLDRISLLKEIEKKSRQLGITASCFVQVNISGEKSKFGLAPQQVLDFVTEAAGMEHVRICGLMTMAPQVEDPEETRPVFRELRLLRDKIAKARIPGVDFLHLSMGMSRDFEVAVEEGATFVRLGSVLVNHE